MIKNILLLVFSFSLTVGFSQNDTKNKSDEIINLEIKSKIPDLKSEVEAGVMNPFTKKLYSEFAIDTFKIGYYFREKTRKALLNSQQRVKFIKAEASKYDSIMNKYYKLSKVGLTPTQKKALINSQNAWEVFRKEELVWVVARLGGDFFDCGYYLEYCNIIKQRMMLMFTYYIDFKEHGY
jgi:hypothetical protein